MKAAIIAIGSEMLGTTRVDTNSLRLTAALETYGVEVVRKSVVGDMLADLVREMEFAFEQVDIVFVTGGLGPTEDDLTREALSKTFDLKMDLDQSIVDRIEKRFAARGWKMPEVNKRQAYVFPGHTTLTNERGTAPGFHLSVRGKHIWVFPGVPNELEWMIETYLKPWLSDAGGKKRIRRVLKVAGLTESALEERLKPYYDAHKGELLTILAAPGGMELHLLHDAEHEITSRETALRDILGTHVFGFDDDTIEGVIGRILTDRRETLSTAESCTGGLLGSRITDVPGSSKYYMGGGVCYTAEAKIAIAGVDATLIKEHGEVSQEVAEALAKGIRERFRTTYGVGITGIAGPTGGSEAKPVGTVHIAVADAHRVEHRKIVWPFTRQLVKWFSTQTALDMLRLFIPGQAARRSSERR
jgi:nicotinamide-nucleotide amidase